MKKYSNKKQAHALRSVFVLSICVIAMAIASWGLYETVFKPSSASGDYLQAKVTVSTPVYTVQPFAISGTVFPSTGFDPEGEIIYIVYETIKADGSVVKSKGLATVDAKNNFLAPDEVASVAGKYTIKLWRDEEETWTVPQVGGEATFVVTDGLPLRATISVKQSSTSKTLFTVQGTVEKVKDGLANGYVSPVTIYFANKFCSKNPLTVAVTRVVNPTTKRISGKFTSTFTWDFAKCGGFWTRPYYGKQWLKDVNGELVQYWYPPESVTPTISLPITFSPTPSKTPLGTPARD